ncbi:trypsin alpha-like [Schistocerca cancellata]|uniref:trypsin alpha-like n=1 Tax=Schistocerca cancellata TaxID=274614 RepID=UPI002118F70E|nr:trypsin alpha-like [Schistocerca cancellata]
MASFHVTVLCLLLAVHVHLVTSRAPRMRSRIDDRIMGGSEDYPWTLALLYTDSQCGASIIGHQWALTAAHCIGRRSSLYTLRSASSNRDSGGTLMDVVEIYEHELHDRNSGDYDMPLMQRLDTTRQSAKRSERAARGYTETDYPIILYKVDIRVSDRSECDLQGGREVTPRMLCAGETGKSTSYGDFGGPLVSSSTQVGIVTWGSGDCEFGGSVYVNDVSTAMPRIHGAVLCLLLAVQLQLAAPRALRLRTRVHGRIIGGSDASIEEFPWQLYLTYAASLACGASIIGPQWALTAAHCVPFSEYVLYHLRAGSSSRDSGGTVLDVAVTYQHEQYDSTSGDYDIAVVRPDGSFPLGTNVAVVNLPEDGYDPPVGLTVTVTGWGMTETTSQPGTLQKVDVSVMERSACYYPDIGREVTPRMLCAGGIDKSPCFGDSGGPLVSGSTQVGIVSWGSDNCDYEGGVYVNVGNLRSWVTNVTNI